MEVIRENYVAIIRNLEPDEVLNFLYQVEVIDSGVRDKVRASTTRKKQAEILVDCIERRGVNALKMFIKSLEESSQKHLAAMLSEGKSAQRKSKRIAERTPPIQTSSPLQRPPSPPPIQHIPSSPPPIQHIPSSPPPIQHTPSSPPLLQLPPSPPPLQLLLSPCNSDPKVEEVSITISIKRKPLCDVSRNVESPINCLYKQKKRKVPNENKEQEENVPIKSSYNTNASYVQED